jgi:L-arabinokinase
MTAARRLTVERFVERLRAVALVERGNPVSIARAPGRLDVMGGIADYSGSLVLQRPIAEATFAAVQQVDGNTLEIVSTGRPAVRLQLAVLREQYRDGSAASVVSRALFSGDTHWASYVAGPLLILMLERGITFDGGLRIVVASDVPEGKGVSSSAALETSVMRALVDALGLTVTPLDQALLCQRAENLIAGAPCGVMDQMACEFGRDDALLALLCQPATLEADVHVPEEVALWGLDSGERHAVGGSDYGAVRTGAFMGLRILREQMAVPGGYLANVATDAFLRLEEQLPEQMTGVAYLREYGGTDDVVTTVEPGRTYKVRIPTAHPVYEHARVNAFRNLLASGDAGTHRRLGELMLEAHASYSACGLGSPGTDRLVDLVRREGVSGGLYGARITGGGSGGTVAVLGRHDAGAAIDRVASAYEAATGYRPYIFSGSSPGVASFATRQIIL